LGFDILDVDHHRASRPRKFHLYYIHDVARAENLAGTDDKAALTLASSSLHLLGSNQQLYPVILAEIFLGLLVTPAGKTIIFSLMPRPRM
jgi:hypothetical protein